MRSRALRGLLFAAALAPSLAKAADPTPWFDKAVQYDLGGEGEAPLAFAWYRRAAEAGLPEAEFNVAVMLDSGRGVARDITQAATWYARAASHGDHRAAYNLGQLYEEGEGVPRNADIARAWFLVSDLPAARGRLAALSVNVARPETLSPALLIAPSGDAKIDPARDGVELVWTSEVQPEPVRFFVEVRALDDASSREVFSAFTGTSSIFATLTKLRGSYAWRVIMVAREASRYAASDWLRFSVAPD